MDAAGEGNKRSRGGLSDELGYASGDEVRQITVDFAQCSSRHV